MGDHSNMLSGASLIRRKQINTLRIFNENVIEVNSDREYRITFNQDMGKALTMGIYLPADFPGGSKPILKIFPAEPTAFNAKLNHPWLDKDNVVIGAPGLNNYGSHSDLGRVVQAVKREFERNPPAVMEPNNDIIQNTSRSISSHTKPSFNEVRAFNGPIPVIANHQPTNNVLMPEIRQYIPEIEQLGKEQLEEIKSDPRALDSFSRKLNVAMFSTMEDRTTSVKGEIQTLTESNSSLSKTLLEKQGKFQENYDSLKGAKEKTALAAQGLKSSCDNFSQATLCDNLLNSCQKDEAGSESCAEHFLNGDLPIEDFISQYVQLRSQYHLKKTKYEKLLNSKRS